MHFSQIAVLLVVAAGFGLVSKVLKQPLLIGYLFAGLFLSVLGIYQDIGALESFANIGVALLLFLLGLEMNLKELPEIGKIALFTGLGQILFTSAIGFVLAYLLGFATLPAIYIAIALTFSSTIIMVKLLSEKKDLNSLYGRISIGFLLVQDFVAVVILMLLSGLREDQVTTYDFILIFAKGIVLILSIWFLAKKVLPYIFDKLIAGSNELLYISSVAWALGVAAVVAGPLGFSLEIGGFLAGIALSGLPGHLQIATRTRPLRDFFLVIFFLTLGIQLGSSGSVISVIPHSILLSMFVLIGNPLIVMVIMGLFGYSKRTSFLSGLTVAQISEFSLILMNMGLSIGHVGDRETSIVVLVGVITMTLSTYMIIGADRLYEKLSRYLSVFEKKQTKEKALRHMSDLKNHIILIGADRTGSNLAHYFQKQGFEFVIIDFNPKVFSRYTAENLPVVFGDMNDPDILEAAGVENCKLIVSTTSHLNSDLTLLEYLDSINVNPNTIFTVDTQKEAIKLYEEGADYVLVPDVVAGDYIKHLLETYSRGGKQLRQLGKSHFKRLVS